LVPLVIFIYDARTHIHKIPGVLNLQQTLIHDSNHCNLFASVPVCFTEALDENFFLLTVLSSRSVPTFSKFLPDYTVLHP